MKYLIGISLLLLLCVNSKAQRTKKIPPEKPKLIVGILIDQMRYDYLSRFSEYFSENGIRKI